MLKICYFHAKHVIPRYLRLFKAIYGLNAQKRLSQSFAGSFLEISVCPRVAPLFASCVAPYVAPMYPMYPMYYMSGLGLRASGLGLRACGAHILSMNYMPLLMSRHKNKLCDTGGKRNEYRAKHVGRLEIT